MIVAVILILVAVALFLIFHDDHDDSYTRREKTSGRKNGPESVYQKSVETGRGAPSSAPTSSAPKPTPVMDSRRDARPAGYAYEEKKVLDYHYLDRIAYDPGLPERTMSSFIAGLQTNCTNKDLGGLVGYVSMDPVTGAMEVHRPDDRLLGYLPMKDRTAFLAFNPGRVVCPFAGHVAISVTGRYYADIRIVLPSSRDFVEESLVGFLG